MNLPGPADAPPSPPPPSMPLNTPQTPQGIPGIPGMMDPSQSVKRFCYEEENVYNVKVQTKAALKGWSALTGDKTGSTPQSAGPKKVKFIRDGKHT